MIVAELAAVDLNALLQSGSLKDFLARVDEEQATSTDQRGTIASRKEDMAEALATLNDEKLIEYQETLSNYVDTLASTAVAFDGSGAELDSTQLVLLMRRHLDTKQIGELTEVVLSGLKRIIFEAITAKVARENPDEPFPQYVSESIEVPELGKRFCKEGAGRKPPLIDQEKLRSLLGEQRWAQVTTEVHVPAHTEILLSEEKLMALATLDPAVLETIKDSLIPAGWKIGSYTVKDIKSRKK